MGQAIAKLGWLRHSYVISTKLFWGIHDDVNMANTLNRKYLLQAIDGSLDGVPADSRANLGGYDWLKGALTDPKRNAKVRALKRVADDLGCTLAQLSIAWCARNPRVSTVITGASRVEQVRENLKVLDVLPLLTDEVMARIEAALH